MDQHTVEIVIEAVKKILETADMNILTESKLRNLATRDTGIDLDMPPYKKMVRGMIKEFLAKCDEDEDTSPRKKQRTEVNAEYKNHGGKHGVEDNDHKEVDSDAEYKQGTDKSNGDVDRDGDSVGKDEEDPNDPDSEEDHVSNDKIHSEKKGQTKFKTDDNGGFIICELGSKRRVTAQKFRGKALISIREYYEKNGKMLPGKKGISLGVEEWKVLKEAIPEVQEAIKLIQEAK